MTGLFYTRHALAAWIEVIGEDAAEFLQGQFSADLRAGVGQATYGLWLDHQGKIQGDSFVLQTAPEAFILTSYATSAEVLVNMLEAKIIADDVTLAPVAETPELVTVFALAESGQTPADGARAEAVVTGRFQYNKAHFAWRGRWPGAWAIDHAGSRTACDALAAELQAEGVAELPSAQFETRRIQAGIPLIGKEIDEGDTPMEAGLMEAVSLTKGCYLGQEVMARASRLGRVTRRLVRVSGATSATDWPELPIALESREGIVVGQLRAWADTADGGVGLAMVRKRFLNSRDKVLIFKYNEENSIQLKIHE